MTSILIIDDDPHITGMLGALLANGSYRVQTACGGRAGLQMLRESHFDVVITDIVMPESDGFEVIMEINRMHPHPRVIAMTGGSMSLNRHYLSQIANAMCVHRVLYKPFGIDELLEAVSGGREVGGEPDQ